MPEGSVRSAFLDVIARAVTDIAEHGYDSPERVKYWVDQLKRSAEGAARPEHELQRMLVDALMSDYRRLVDRGDLLKRHTGVARFTIDRLRPHLRAELDRRILASADLIRRNREAAIAKTLQRFSAWSTSIPKGGTDALKRAEVKASMRKSLASLPFEERRVIIDQGHKLRSSLSEIIAVDGGAIAARWRSRWRQAGYNYRQDHKDRDDRVYAVRGSWALERGFAKVGPAGYTDDITKPGEEPFCRCYYQYLYNLRDLPDEMVTKRGRDALEEMRQSRA
jgi:hypothetical protein